MHGEPAGPAAPAAGESAGTQRIQAVDRAVALLKSVADATTPPTALELAQACGINRSTAWRLLAVRTGESVTLAVAKRFNLVYVDQVDPPNVVMPSWPGKPLPLHATSGGKVFLAWLGPDERDAILPKELPRYTERTITDRGRLDAELDEVRRVGYGLCTREYEEFSSGASAAVLSSRQYPVAVINVWGPAARNPAKKLHEIGRAAVRTAHEVRTLLD